MVDLSHIISDMKTDTKQATTKDMENLLNEDYKETMQGKTEERKNRFNGESIMLTKEEANKHDRIFINEIGATIEDKEAGIEGTSKLWDKVRKDLEWFRQHNAKAYMVLLD
jgi:hypothetical protein